ncbi:DEKNAAC102963 [Brettanomyces naardenensis]|uniref:Mitochondrial glycine transporter n=1 Tax=Brettanomyces naardenensis TaxID=13370 RepID=A0A448YMB9_BRENA|nr:DEKNAAC102963 [Brettanomyces naardenensis]
MSRDVPTSRHLVAGFTGGLASAICLQPLDLVKTRVQQSKTNSITSVLKEMNSAKELWRGTIPSALRTSIGSALYLSSLNFMRTQMAASRSLSHPALESQSSTSKLPRLPASENLIAGMVARAVVGFITMPITMVKVRFESDMYHYASLKDAVVSMYTKEGFSSFFTGFGATVLRDAPYAGLYVAFYEENKALFPKLIGIRRKKDSDGSPVLISSTKSAAINSISAMMAAFFATAITGPFDTIKTNMQLDPQRYKSFGQTAVSLARENWRRLFDGLSLRLLRKAGSAGIAWCIYEEIVRL